MIETGWNIANQSRMFFLLALLLVSSSACKVNVGRLSQDDKIPKAIVDSARKIRQQALIALQRGDSNALKALYNRKLRSKLHILDEIRHLIESYQKNYSGITFGDYHEYYYKGAEVGTSDGVIPSNTREPFLMLINKSLCSEAYISLQRTKTGEINSQMAMRICKEDDSWRLFGIFFSPFEVKGRSAIAWLDLAIQAKKQGRFFQAFSDLAFALELIKPAPFITYPREKELLSFAQDLRQQLAPRYKLPRQVLVKNVELQVFEIHPELVLPDVYPMVNYVTKLPLTESSLLKEEASLLIKQLKIDIPEIFANSSLVLTRAYQKLPRAGEPSTGFGAIVED